MTSYDVGDDDDDNGGNDDGGDDDDGGAMMVATTLCTCELLILYESYVGMLEPPENIHTYKNGEALSLDLFK